MRFFAVAAGVLFLLGFLPYVVAIWRGQAKPAKATWLIWGIVDTVIVAGMYSTNALNWQMIGCTLGTWLVAALALKYGAPGWTRLDKYSLAVAVTGILVWLAQGDPVFGILISLGVVVLGSVPTIISAWQEPGRESRVAWLMFWVSCIFAIIAIPRWTIADAAQPLVFLSLQSAMVGILYLRRHAPTTT